MTAHIGVVHSSQVRVVVIAFVGALVLGVGSWADVHPAAAQAEVSTSVFPTQACFPAQGPPDYCFRDQVTFHFVQRPNGGVVDMSGHRWCFWDVRTTQRACGESQFITIVNSQRIQQNIIENRVVEDVQLGDQRCIIRTRIIVAYDAEFNNPQVRQLVIEDAKCS